MPTKAIGSGLFWLGLVLGCFVGAAFTLMGGAEYRYTSTKNSVPGMRKDAWRFTGKFGKFVVVVGVLAAVSLFWLTGFKLSDSNTKPASVPIAPPSRPGE